MRGPTRAPSGRERGAALVEAAIVTPVVVAAVVLLVLSSVLWRDRLAATDAAAVGARVAGLHPVVAAAPEAPGLPLLEPGTPRVLAAVAQSLGAVPPEVVERVVIFGAPLGGEASTALVPRGCLGGSDPGPAEPCLVLGPDALADPSSVPGCGPGACPWRDAPGIEVVGVLVRLQRPGPLGGILPPPTMEAVALSPREGVGDG